MDRLKLKPGSKKQVKYLTLKKKLEILDCLKQDETVKTMSRKHGVCERTIHLWKKNETALREEASHCNMNHKNTRRPDQPEVEKQLYSWAVSQRDSNTKITADILKTKAMMIYDNLSKSNTLPPFTATQGWFRKFKARFGLKLLASAGEKASADLSACKVS